MHKEIKNIKLNSEGGILIQFRDGDHTYIIPEVMMEIAEATIKLLEEEEDE